MNIYEKLTAIQNALKAPKSAKNDFGGYMYRRIDDINEALKPLLDEYKASVTLEDTLELVGDRYYVRSVAIFTDSEKPEAGERRISAIGWAREPLTKKGSDESQVTGAATTYARKYALTALFLLDDSENDPDSQAPAQEEKPQAKKPQGKKCVACGALVTDKKLIAETTARWQKVVCIDCINKKKAEAEAKKKAEAQNADLPFPI